MNYLLVGYYAGSASSLLRRCRCSQQQITTIQTAVSSEFTWLLAAEYTRYSHRMEEIRTRIDTVMFSVRPRCLPLGRVQVNSPSLEHQSPIRRRLISIFTFAGFLVNHPQSCVPGGSGCVRLLTSHSTVILNSISRAELLHPRYPACAASHAVGGEEKKRNKLLTTGGGF